MTLVCHQWKKICRDEKYEYICGINILSQYYGTSVIGRALVLPVVL